MKRCSRCNRVETDEALKFCRVDGAALVSESASLGGEDASEVQTSILSHQTDADMTTKRFVEHVDETKGEKQKQFKVFGAIGILLIAALGIGSYWYFTRDHARQIDSIAVMPFVNESGNADVDYLSDGMTETMINTLTGLPNLNVKPRSSTFRYKGRESEAKTIGRELNVNAILNGRLVQRGDEITLFLSLIDTGTENQIWGKQ